MPLGLTRQYVPGIKSPAGKKVSGEEYAQRIVLLNGNRSCHLGYIKLDYIGGNAAAFYILFYLYINMTN